MRCSCWFFSEPRQYAAAVRISLNAVADPLGGGQVRPAAEVLPRQLAVAAEVVVDGQLAAADLGVGALGGVRPLSPLSPISSSL